MNQSQFHKGSCFGRHGRPAASLSGRDISNHRPNSVSAGSDFAASARSSGSISASYWKRIVFLSLYLRLSATSSRSASAYQARGWRGSSARTKFTTFITARGACAGAGSSAWAVRTSAFSMLRPSSRAAEGE